MCVSVCVCVCVCVCACVRAWVRARVFCFVTVSLFEPLKRVTLDVGKEMSSVVVPTSLSRCPDLFVAGP